LPRRGAPPDTGGVIANVIVHIHGELPIVVDLEDMPQPNDRSIRCTNVRTVDGKRPAFVHDRHSTFVFPLSVIRLLEAPSTTPVPDDEFVVAGYEPPAPPPPAVDEEPDEDLLARIRSV
jgi:hypothetical protein